MSIHYVRKEYEAGVSDEHILDFWPDHLGSEACWGHFVSNHIDYPDNTKVGIYYKWYFGNPYNGTGGAGRYDSNEQRDAVRGFWGNVALPTIMEDTGIVYTIHDEGMVLILDGENNDKPSYFRRFQQILHDIRMFTEWPGVAKTLYGLHTKGVPFLDALALVRGHLFGQDENGKDVVIPQNSFQVCHMLGYRFNPLYHRARRRKVQITKSINKADSVGDLMNADLAGVGRIKTPFGVIQRVRGKYDPRVPDWAVARGMHVLDVEYKDFVEYLYSFWKENMSND